MKILRFLRYGKYLIPTVLNPLCDVAGGLDKFGEGVDTAAVELGMAVGWVLVGCSIGIVMW